MNQINNILLGIGAFVALAVAVTLIGLLLMNAHLRVQIAQAQQNNTACHLANDNFTTSVRKQNAAVKAMQQLAVQREKKARDAAYKAQQAARAWYLAADKIEKQKIIGDQCRAAEQLIDRYLDGKK